eukprot:gene12536-15752_t
MTSPPLLAHAHSFEEHSSSFVKESFSSFSNKQASPSDGSSSFIHSGRSPPSSTVLGTSPPTSLSSSEKDSAGAKRFLKRLQHDVTLDPTEYSVCLSGPGY